jgi:alpha-aminoadipate/glutamate carrier protein LysW
MPMCPACDADVELDELDVDKGEIVSCPECGVDLEVVGLSPLELDLAPPGDDEADDAGDS